MSRERVNDDLPTPSENPNQSQFEPRARDFLAKHDLILGIDNIDEVIKHAQDFLERYQVPESFIEDKINLALIIGCSQKLVESTDVYYRSRVDNFQKRLIAPVIPEGLIDEEDLWGKDSDRAGITDEKMAKYLEEKTDPEATKEFLEKYVEELNRCKVAWKVKGYDLEIEAHIVSDEPGQFEHKTRARGFVHVPDRNKLNDPEETKGSYWSAKQFWDKLSFIGDLDFHLLGDRRQLLDTVITKYGVDGLVDLALVFAHGGGKIRAFETFYNYPERGVLAVILAGQKIILRKALTTSNINLDIPQTVRDINTLTEYLTPDGSRSMLNYYGQLYRLVPSVKGESYAARVIDPDTFSSRADNEFLKQLILSYTYGLAIFELTAQGNKVLNEGDYKMVEETLVAVPFRREEPNFTVENFIKEQKALVSLIKDQDQFLRYVYSILFQRFVLEVGAVEMAYHLQNPNTKGAILQQFYDQLDCIALHVNEQSTPEYIEEFVDSIFGFNLPFEIRNSACEHILAKYPTLKPTLEKARSNFDSRKFSSHG